MLTSRLEKGWAVCCTVESRDRGEAYKIKYGVPGIIFRGMELFPAANEDQWTLIKGVIDDCDYYIVVIGGRYGSVSDIRLSYTEIE